MAAIAAETVPVKACAQDHPVCGKDLRTKKMCILKSAPRRIV
jgi:hypothetical protein